MKIVYDAIGTAYNSTRQADPCITGRLLFFLNARPGNYYLDIGCGTGNYAIALSIKGLNFFGVEPSEKMLTEARKSDQKINWLLGSAEHIPTASNTVDGVIATLTIHHWTDIDQATKEIYRVTKDGGKVIFFTAAPEQMRHYWLNYYFPKMLQSSIIQMPTPGTINRALTNAGFKITAIEKYVVHEDLQDHFLFAGKHKPELYFDKKIRKGISSFSALANAKKVATGLAKLKSDLENGRFSAIKNSYDDDNLGDYLFIVAEKKL